MMSYYLTKKKYDKAFTHIMMEVQSVDLGLLVPIVEKRVDK